jgi:hypothetical protein
MVVYGLVKDNELVATKGAPTGLFKTKAAAAKAQSSLTEEKAQGVAILAYRLAQTIVV